MKRIVVTGSKGGTGRSIVQVLRQHGYDVISIDLLPRDVTGDDGYIQLDLRDAAGLNDALAGAQGVIHFGSPPADAWLTTTEAFHMVAVAGFNVFQAAKNTGIDRIAWASSIEVYGDLREQPLLPMTEDSPLAPPGIYGTSKLLLERLAYDFCRWHRMSIAGFRLSRIIYDNDFGRQKLSRFVNDESLGHDSIWSYIDARDVATACLSWLESDHQGAEVFNIAAANVHQDTPVTELLKKYGYADMPVGDVLAEDQTLFSTRKIRDMLDWSERYDWRDITSSARNGA